MILFYFPSKHGLNSCCLDTFCILFRKVTYNTISPKTISCSSWQSTFSSTSLAWRCSTCSAELSSWRSAELCYLMTIPNQAQRLHHGSWLMGTPAKNLCLSRHTRFLTITFVGAQIDTGSQRTHISELRHHARAGLWNHGYLMTISHWVWRSHHFLVFCNDCLHPE